MLVFIDESGDPGFKLSKGSSSHFVMALVAFSDRQAQRYVTVAIDKMARANSLRNEFKFGKSRNRTRDLFFRTVLPFEFCVRAIVVDKSIIYSTELRSNKESFYAYFTKSMLKFDNRLLVDAKVVIDGSGDRTFKQEMASYLKAHTAPGSIKKVTFSNSKNDRMIQLADMCVGAIARSQNPDKMHADRWHNMLQPKIENIWNFR
jgi:Protein of unknown function (DUF3800)